MAPCLFCRVRDGEIPSRIVHQDAHCLAFEDIAPAAPSHVLVIPKLHIASMNALTPEHAALMGHLLLTCANVAKARGLSEPGFRVVVNTHTDGGQTVHHLHLHVLGGRQMTWPPG
ncbi:MAG: histidine triad nucleotide-binding protein [Myxococcaceae bacterium]